VNTGYLRDAAPSDERLIATPERSARALTKQFGSLTISG
jgi:hypothetical protein